MTEKQLLNDILESFHLPKSVLKDLADYERELIYETYNRYDRKYLQDLLFRARYKGNKGISDTAIVPETTRYQRPTEYIIKHKPKKFKGGDYRIEEIKNKGKENYVQ